MTTCCTTVTDDSGPIIITQGADTTLTFVAKNDDGTPLDLTGAKAYFTVKRHWKDLTSSIAYKNAAAGGYDARILITLPQVVPNIGQLKVMIAAADSALLNPDLLYVVDCWAITSANLTKVVTKMRDLDVMPRVTILP